MLNKLLHARVEVTVEDLVELGDAFWSVVGYRKDVTILSEYLIRIIDLTNDKFIDGHSTLISLVRDLRPNLHKSILKHRRLVEHLFLLDLYLLLGFLRKDQCVFLISILNFGFLSKLLFTVVDFSKEHSLEGLLG